MILKLAFRNLKRNRRRTILTICMMVFGFVLSSFFIALNTGAYNGIIFQFIGAQTGEIQVHHSDYLDEPKLYKAISSPEKIIANLKNDKSVKSASSRIRGGALAFHNKKTFGVNLVGIDVKAEPSVSTLFERVTTGKFPSLNSDREVVIGRKVAKILKLSIGESIVLISSGADGSIANDQYTVSGIIDSGSSSIDDMNVYLPLESAQDYFSLWGRVHEIVIRTTDQEFDHILDIPKELTQSSWQQVESDFYKAMLADRKGDAIGRFIIILLVALGVFNTVLMSIMERTREFGVLKAIGTTPTSLVLLIISEILMLGLASIVIGSILSFGLNTYFSIYGIELETAIEYGGFKFEEMKAAVNADSFIMPTLSIFFTAIIVSLYPAYKAAKVLPVEAMRS